MAVSEETLREIREAQDRLAKVVKKAEVEAASDQKMNAAVQTSMTCLNSAIDNMYF